MNKVCLKVERFFGLIFLSLVLSLKQGWCEKTIEIEKAAERLRIVDGGEVLAEYSCSIGKGGAEAKQKRGDNLTPEGEYRIVRINRQSGFHIFLHLSYPNLDDIERAKAAGQIGDSLYQVLKPAAERNALPPQNTVLGGDVGIHGLRNKMSWLGRLHRAMNWTQGCVAVTNPEIEAIASQVKVGTKVVIRK